MSAELTDLEHELFVEATYQLVRLFKIRVPSKNRPEIWHHNYTSELADPFRTLVQLHILKEENDGDFVPILPLDEVRHHLQQIGNVDRPTYLNILSFLLWEAVNYDYEGGISDDILPFKVSPKFQRLMLLFAELEFVDCVNDSFRWNETAFPLFKKAELWHYEADATFTTHYRQSSEKLADEIWAAIPSWRKHLLARSVIGKSEYDIVPYFDKRWDGKKLRYFETSQRQQQWYQNNEHMISAIRIIINRLLNLRSKHWP